MFSIFKTRDQFCAECNIHANMQNTRIILLKALCILNMNFFSSPFWATRVWQRLLWLNIGVLLLAHGGIFQISLHFFVVGVTMGLSSGQWHMSERNVCYIQALPCLVLPLCFCLNLNGLSLEEGGTSRRKGLRAYMNAWRESTPHPQSSVVWGPVFSH